MCTQTCKLILSQKCTQLRLGQDPVTEDLLGNTKPGAVTQESCWWCPWNLRGLNELFQRVFHKPNLDSIWFLWFFNFFFFNWIIVDLQCCVSFRWTAKWFIYTYISYTFIYIHTQPQASLVAQTVKNLPSMQEIWIQSLGRDNPLKKVMATHSRILAWRIPWQGSLVDYLLSLRSQIVRHNWVTKKKVHTHTHIYTHSFSDSFPLQIIPKYWI